MTRTPATRSRAWIPLFIAVCLVAINMRMTIGSIGPLLDDIAADQGVSSTALGLLASIPLFTWALVSPLAHGIATRIGLDAAVSWALVVLAVATVVRSLPGSPINLWVGTAFIGVALAITNVLMPAAVKRDFGSRVPLVMGVYSALLGGAAAIGAGMVAPIAHAEPVAGEPLGWRWALLATGATVPLALVVWVWATRRYGSRAAVAPARPGLGKRVWRDPVAWIIACYMGTQSSNFYVYATWLAPIDVSRGTDPVTAGVHVMTFHMCGVVGSLVAPFASRGRGRHLMPLVTPVLGFTGALGVVFAPDLLLLWFTMCGLSCGLGLSIALTFVAQRSPSTEVAGAVSGMSQSFGYLVAAIGPVAFGWLHGITGGWGLALVAIAIAGVAQFAAGALLRRDQMVTVR